MYHIRLFENTGFNSVNVPYSKEYLTKAANKVYDSAVGDLSGFNGQLPPLDIIQNRNLASIRINAPWSWVNQADYVILYTHSDFTSGMTDAQKKAQVEEEIRDNGWCYIITNCVMANTDTVVLSLAPDYLTSVNAALEIADADDESSSDLPIRIIDGIVSRSTWALKQVMNDATGTLTVLDVDMNDPMLIPSGTMKLKTDRSVQDTLGNNGDTIILSTIDLSSAHNYNAQKFVVTNQGASLDDAVVVPVLDYVSDAHSLSFAIQDFDTPPNTNTQPYPGVCGVEFSGVSGSNNLRKALSNIRALGLESAIVDQYFVPSQYITVTTSSGLISQITGKSGYLQDWRTERVSIGTHEGTIGDILNYSPYETCGLVSATGSKIEVHPQDLRASDGGKFTGVLPVAFISDPRPDGRPYFTIVGIHGVTLGITTLLLNCVEGLNWQKVPLTWNQGASGNALNTVRYNASFSLGQDLTQLQMRNAASMYNLTNKPMISRVLEGFGSALQDKPISPHDNYTEHYVPSYYINSEPRDINAGFIDSTGIHHGLSSNNNALKQASSDVLSKIGEGINNIAHAPGLNALFGYDLKAQQYSNDFSETLGQFIHDSVLDRLEYDISNSYYAPTVSFPYSANIWDFLGNGVVRYKYEYDGEHEEHRLKTILKAYGLQYKEYLSKKYFGDDAIIDSYDGGAKSTPFCYVQTSSASVSGRARWINEGIAAQLNNGVRFWKGKPRHIMPKSGE